MNTLFIIPLLLDIPMYIIILAAAGLLLFIAILVLIIFTIKRPRGKHPMRKVLNNNGINELIEALGGRDVTSGRSASGARAADDAEVADNSDTSNAADNSNNSFLVKIMEDGTLESEKRIYQRSEKEMIERASEGYFVRDAERNIVYCPVYH